MQCCGWSHLRRLKKAAQNAALKRLGISVTDIKLVRRYRKSFGAGKLGLTSYN
ncbi:hypothetical protein COO91_08560 [Nostoc flagelliforme CCNUN1]|uniref:Uncharacterized protein n=1 Tax=Nostoc flagelliforme CCNUN1 TaxID=2038116 RepID=A0A2K8T3Z7_9NOSO|nr:hypothetical protein COO91_08560 [Nostoc flagelliforme CCNUN1]